MQHRFVGSLLGLALGDALGRHFEGAPASYLRERYADVGDLQARLPEPPWRYTDDTQMAIGVAEALQHDGEIREATLCRAFVENYEPHRGYGHGARVVLQAMEEGQDYQHWANELFPGGSYGNGAAMRVAPVGLMFRADRNRCLQQARLSSLPTHVHPLGVQGAELIAWSVALAANTSALDCGKFYDALEQLELDELYRYKLSQARKVSCFEDLEPLGNGIEAQESVVSAIACFTLFADSFEQTVLNAIWLGGDTDTIAAMAGAIAGAYLGAEALPNEWLERLENHGKGRDYLEQLARQLADA